MEYIGDTAVSGKKVRVRSWDVWMSFTIEKEPSIVASNCHSCYPPYALEGSCDLELSIFPAYDCLKSFTQETKSSHLQTIRCQ